MYAIRRFLLLAGVASIALLGFHTPPASSQNQQQQPAKPRVDVGKSLVIEPPLKAIFANRAKPAPVAAPRVDRGKNDVIEPQMKQFVLNTLPVKGDRFVNPKVAPGKVRWHATMAAAKDAAAKSKKPVLLFHMMGKLDDQFC
jgi:hypothetical protein